jgi:CRISPR-associated protein Csb1
MALTYEVLRADIAGRAVGIRCRTVLEPLGGRGDKVFPPTYGSSANPDTKYATESRYVPSEAGSAGAVLPSVLLDSVASQANRLELALLRAIRSGELAVPVTSVDFRPIKGLAGLDRISDYEASHRIFDAILRDSYDGEHLFRNGPVGQAVTGASSRDAAGLYYHSPHTLVFGGWDSTGPRGGLGAKYERAITSEIVGIGVTPGVRTSSRIDSAGIELQAGPLYQVADGTWTLNEAEAELDSSGKAKLLGAKNGARQGGREAGRPSQANHGNVTPSVEDKSGGVTAEKIIGTTVLSFIQLRRLRFPTGPDGAVLDDRRRSDAEVAARTALAALGLAAATLAFEEGFDLRSRCVLVNAAPIVFESVLPGGAVGPFELSSASALKLVAECADRAAAAGLPWRDFELTLRPAERLVELIRRSNNLAVIGESGDN